MIVRLMVTAMLFLLLPLEFMIYDDDDDDYFVGVGLVRSVDNCW